MVTEPVTAKAYERSLERPSRVISDWDTPVGHEGSLTWGARRPIRVSVSVTAVSLYQSV